MHFKVPAREPETLYCFELNGMYISVLFPACELLIPVCAERQQVVGMREVLVQQLRVELLKGVVDSKHCLPDLRHFLCSFFSLHNESSDRAYQWKYNRCKCPRPRLQGVSRGIGAEISTSSLHLECTESLWPISGKKKFLETRSWSTRGRPTPLRLPLAPEDACGRYRMDLSYALPGTHRSPIVQKASFQPELSLPAAARPSIWTWPLSRHLRFCPTARKVRRHRPQKPHHHHQQ